VRCRPGSQALREGKTVSVGLFAIGTKTAQCTLGVERLLEILDAKALNSPAGAALLKLAKLVE
jgi:hypothetical protein